MQRTISTLLLALGLTLVPALVRAEDDGYLGRLSTNRYGSQSIGNLNGAYGSPYRSRSVTNPDGAYGSPYSSRSATNPYATNTPKIYGSDGRYLGKLSSNPYDSESISNPNGRYGNPNSLYSVKNPNGPYGSPYSSRSVTNPYATDAPRVYGTPKPTYTPPRYGAPRRPLGGYGDR